MGDEAKRHDPTVPGTGKRVVDPSAPTRGTEQSDLGNTPPSAFEAERAAGGRDFRQTAAARDSRELTFRCADTGRLGCNWELTGQSKEEMLPAIERHGREEHNQKLDESTRGRILDAIHRRSAA
jgi:predicted small metal-binding protein